MDTKKKFCKKVKDEYRHFKKKMLKKRKKEIFREAYKIDVFANLYNILTEKAETLSDGILQSLLSSSGVMDVMYDSWLKKDDSSFDELMQCVEQEIKKAEDLIQPGRSMHGEKGNKTAQGR